MATAAETIKLALRKLRVIGQGANPNSAQQTDALTELNAYLNELAGFGSSLQWRDYYVDSACEIIADYPAQRLLCRHGSALTITLPEGTAGRPIADGFRVGIVDATNAAATYNITLARNGWKIAGSAANATISTNSASVVYMFRADLGDWKLAANLSTGDSLPFPAEFDLAIALLLANRLSGEYGQNLAESDRYAMIAGKAKLMNRYCPPPILYPEGAVSNLGGVALQTGQTGIDQSVA